MTRGNGLVERQDSPRLKLISCRNCGSKCSQFDGRINQNMEKDDATLGTTFSLFFCSVGDDGSEAYAFCAYSGRGGREFEAHLRRRDARKIGQGSV